MNIVFLGILIALTYYAYQISRKDFLSPWFVLCLMFLCVFNIVLLNKTSWNVKFSKYSIFLITLSLLMWGIGGGIVSFRDFRIMQCEDKKLYQRLRGTYPATLIFFVSCICTFLYVLLQLKEINIESGITAGIRQIYENAINNTSGNFFKNQLLEIVIASTYISIYRIFIKIFILKKEDHVKYPILLMPIFFFFIAIIFSTDRNKFIRICIYISVLFVFFIRQQQLKNVNFTIVRKMILLMIIVLICFYILGKTKQYKSNFFNSLSIYGGSGLNNLNIFINEYPFRKLNTGDSGTFYSIQNVLAQLGIMPKSSFNRIDEFITFQTKSGYTYASNVYTALKTYFYDYGVLGLIIFPFISGMIYEYFYRHVNQKKLGFSCVLYASLLYPIVYYPILEQMFNRMHLGLIYEIFWLTSLFYIIYGKYGIWRIHTPKHFIQRQKFWK